MKTHSIQQHNIIQKTKLPVMAALTIETLQKICDKIPSEYTIKVETSNGTLIEVADNIEVDISKGTLILKQY